VTRSPSGWGEGQTQAPGGVKARWGLPLSQSCSAGEAFNFPARGVLDSMHEETPQADGQMRSAPTPLLRALARTRQYTY
jgi:hypothetical protein